MLVLQSQLAIDGVTVTAKYQGYFISQIKCAPERMVSNFGQQTLLNTERQRLCIVVIWTVSEPYLLFVSKPVCRHVHVHSGGQRIL